MTNPREGKLSSVIDYLTTQSSKVRCEQYKDHFTVMVVFRCLPPLAKQFVLRMILLQDIPIPVSYFRSWRDTVNETLESRIIYSDTILRLKKLGIIVKSNKPIPSNTLQQSIYNPLLKKFIQLCNDDTTNSSSSTVTTISESKKTNISNSTIDTKQNQKSSQENPEKMLYTLDTNVRECLIQVLCSSISLDVISNSSSNNVDDTMSGSMLNEYAQNTWNRVLHFLVGIPHPNGVPAQSIQDRLIRMELIEPHLHNSKENERIILNYSGNPIIDQHSITPKGVQFLFLSQHAQIWEIVLFYLMYITSQEIKIDALRLLFRLSFMTIGSFYPTKDITDDQRNIIKDLHDIGLVYYRPQENKVYPTRLILNLSGITSIPINKQNPKNNDAISNTNNENTTTTNPYVDLPKYIIDDQCHIIIETSFKVHAFTRSPLMIAILSFIVDFKYRLPNVVMGHINRKSIRRALLNNLDSSTILQWLNEHLHPLMYNSSTSLLVSTQQQQQQQSQQQPQQQTQQQQQQQEHFSLNYQQLSNTTSEFTSSTNPPPPKIQRRYIPKNVISQIEQWEGERLRFQLQDAVLLKDFHSSQEYEMWYDYTKKKKLLLFNDSERLILVVTPAGFDAIVREKSRIEGKTFHSSV